MLQKNEEVRVQITDLTQEGEGIGRADGFPLFIKDALPGDTVRAAVTKLKKTYGYGRVLAVEEASPDRVAARCGKARPCGGCQIQELSYGAQLAFKERTVREQLTRLGGFADPPVRPILGMEEPWAYRNKAVYPVRTGRDGRLLIGFYAGRTHAVVESPDCPIGAPENERIVGIVRAWMEAGHVPAYDEETGAGLVRHILIRRALRTGQILVCLIVNGDRIPREEALVRELSAVPGMTGISLCGNRTRGNAILGETVRVLWGGERIRERLGDVIFEISPLSFFQVNTLQAERLYGAALEAAGLTGSEKVWDLYCGTGTISLFLARRAAFVYGNEVIGAAVEDARRNARANGIENAEFFEGKAEEILPALYEKDPERYRADVVVVDPPRRGCDPAVLETILSMAPGRVVYVSCNPSTLARDARILCGGGYRLDSAQPVDMFPHTVSIECVCRLSRRTS